MTGVTGDTGFPGPSEKLDPRELEELPVSLAIRAFRENQGKLESLVFKGPQELLGSQGTQAALEFEGLLVPQVLKDLLDHLDLQELQELLVTLASQATPEAEDLLALRASRVQRELLAIQEHKDFLQMELLESPELTHSCWPFQQDLKSL